MLSIRTLLSLLFFLPSLAFAQFQANAAERQIDPLKGMKSRSQRVAEYVWLVMSDTVSYPCAEVIIDTLNIGDQFEGHVLVYLRSLSRDQYVSGDPPYMESFLMFPDSAQANGLFNFSRGDCQWQKQKAK